MNTKEYMKKMNDTRQTLRSWLQKELKEMAEKNPDFATKYDPKADLKPLLDFIEECARAIAVKNCACLSESQVRRIAMDWYMDGIGEKLAAEKKAEEEKRRKTEEKYQAQRMKSAAELLADNIATAVKAIATRIEVKRLTHHPIKRQAALFDM